MILTGLTGDVIMSLSHNYLVERGFIASPEVYYIPTDIDLPLLSYTWTTVYRRGIEKNKLRNRIIINMLLTLYKKGFKVLVIVGRKEHGRLLLRALAKRKVENVFFSFGGRSVEEWDVENDNAVTSEFSTDELHKHIGALDKAILIGSSTYDEGVDLPSISVCMLVAGGKSLRQSLQRVGRVLRKHGDKKALIIDFADRFHPFLAKHARARRAIFEHVGFPVYDGFPDVLLS
jgi:superfamily II DNA or RNA helicase